MADEAKRAGGRTSSNWVFPRIAGPKIQYLIIFYSERQANQYIGRVAIDVWIHLDSKILWGPGTNSAWPIWPSIQTWESKVWTTGGCASLCQASMWRNFSPRLRREPAWTRNTTIGSSAPSSTAKWTSEEIPSRLHTSQMTQASQEQRRHIILWISGPSIVRHSAAQGSANMEHIVLLHMRRMKYDSPPDMKRWWSRSCIHPSLCRRWGSFFQIWPRVLCNHLKSWGQAAQIQPGSEWQQWQCSCHWGHSKWKCFGTRRWRCGSSLWTWQLSTCAKLTWRSWRRAMEWVWKSKGKSRMPDLPGPSWKISSDHCIRNMERLERSHTLKKSWAYYLTSWRRMARRDLQRGRTLSW